MSALKREAASVGANGFESMLHVITAPEGVWLRSSISASVEPVAEPDLSEVLRIASIAAHKAISGEIDMPPETFPNAPMICFVDASDGIASHMRHLDDAVVVSVVPEIENGKLDAVTSAYLALARRGYAVSDGDRMTNDEYAQWRVGFRNRVSELREVLNLADGSLHFREGD